MTGAGKTAISCYYCCSLPNCVSTTSVLAGAVVTHPHLIGYARTYINQIEAQELLEPWTSSDPCISEEPSRLEVLAC
jgi:hypothetical protein